MISSCCFRAGPAAYLAPTSDFEESVQVVRWYSCNRHHISLWTSHGGRGGDDNASNQRAYMLKTLALLYCSRMWWGIHSYGDRAEHTGMCFSKQTRCQMCSCLLGTRTKRPGTSRCDDCVVNELTGIYFVCTLLPEVTIKQSS